MNKINTFMVVDDLVRAVHLDQDPRTIIETDPKLIIIKGHTRANGSPCRISIVVSRDEENQEAKEDDTKNEKEN